MTPIVLESESVAGCPLCHHAGSVAFDRVTDTLMAEINRYLPAGHAPLPTDLEDVRRCCAACGYVYLSPRLDGASLATVYSLWYRYAYRRVMTDPAHVAERLREFEHHHLRLLEAEHPVRGRLLDVGCGSGLFLGLAQARGWTVAGIELDPETAAWGREHGGVRDIRCGTLAGAFAADECFDVITMFDYLEHTPTPGADLDRLAARLAPSGTLMVRVPNAGGWQARWLGRDWLAVMATHLGYFTPPVLAAALRARGLDVVRVDAGNCVGQRELLLQRWRWLRQRLAARRGITAQADGSVAPLPSLADPGGAALRWLRSLWLEQLDHVGGWFGRGNNLTVIARKGAA